MPAPSLKESLICGFGSSREAFAFERAAVTHGLAGRLIPTPPELRADCGLAWMSEPEELRRLQDLVEKEQLSCQFKIVKMIRC